MQGTLEQTRRDVPVIADIDFGLWPEMSKENGRTRFSNHVNVPGHGGNIYLADMDENKKDERCEAV